MNHGNDPSSPWQQVVVHFDVWDAAEHSAVAHLGPLLTDAKTSGLVASWFFIRKNPCWRLRFLPTDDTTTQDATTLIHQGLDSLHETGRIARWVATIYEPEAYAFGGPAAMDTAHHLFHQDSRHILAHLGSDRATASAAGGDQRRELSILLCSILMRGASQDWYEQGDIWARVTEHRCPPPDAPPDRLRAMEAGLRRLRPWTPHTWRRTTGHWRFSPTGPQSLTTRARNWVNLPATAPSAGACAPFSPTT